MGKGSKRRPCTTGTAENNLRWALAEGRITFNEFEKRYKKLLEANKITRDGRVINENDLG